MEDQQKLERAVLGFLRTRGYAKAEKAFTGEAQLGANLEVYLEQHQLEDVNAKSKVLYHSLTTDLAEAYKTSYDKLRIWIDESLDKYKEELSLVLWPLYVHAYLELLHQGETEGARQFLEMFEKFQSHSDDINRLKALLLVEISSVSDLEQNPEFRVLRSEPHEVPVSSYSCQLLMTHLLEGRHLHLLALLNDHVRLRVVSRAPDVRPVMHLQGAGHEPVLWGRLGSTISLVQAVPEDSEGDARGRKRKAEETGDAGAAASEGVAGGGGALRAEETLVKSKIPLGELPASTLLQQQEDTRLAAPLSAYALPSISMLTFFHTNGSLNCVQMADDGSKVVAGLNDSSIRLWDLAAENAVVKGAGAAVGSENYQSLVGHSGAVTSASFSPCSRFLLSGSEDSTVRLWGLETHSKSALVAYKGHNYPVWDVAFSPFGYYFATASHDRTGRVFSTDRVFPVRMFAGHLSDVDCVAWHPNSNYLATGSVDNSIRLWDVSSGDCVRIFTGHIGSIYSLAFSPDGSQLASAADDHTVGIWDIASSKGIAVLGSHEKTVWSLDYDATGNILATGSQDGTVKLWDPKAAVAIRRTGQRDTTSLLQTFRTKKTPVMKVKFTRRNVLMAAGELVL